MKVLGIDPGINEASYAILDDDADFLPHQWLFKTNFNDGITEEIAQAVIDHLNAGERAYA